MSGHSAHTPILLAVSGHTPLIVTVVVMAVISEFPLSTHYLIFLHITMHISGIKPVALARFIN